MKRIVSIIICLLMTAAVFCSCGESAGNTNGINSESAATEAQKTLKKADFGWVKCDVPDGYFSKVFFAGTQHYSIRKNGTNDYADTEAQKVINLFLIEKRDDKDMQYFIDEQIGHYVGTGGVLEDTFDMGGFKWYAVVNDDGVHRYYAEVDEKNVVGAVALGGMSVKDEPVKTVLSSIEILDLSKFGETESTEDDHLKVDPIS